MLNIEKEELEKIVKDSVSFYEVLKKIKFANNGTGQRKTKKLIQDFGIDTSHFSFKASVEKFHRKYKLITKICPVCGKNFESGEGDPREKQTCSHSCSNTYFSHLRNKPERHTNYRTICFKSWKKECIVCGFEKVVEVHHIDHNHSNNDRHNLVPVCPNHHQMLHTNKWAEETKQEIIKLIQFREVCQPTI